MKYNNLYLLIATFILFALQACDKYDPQLGDPPTAADASFSFAPSADNDNIIEFTASNPDIILKWDLGNGTTATGAEVTGVYPNQGTYTVKLTVFARGGSASSTQEVVIDQTDFTLLDNPVYNMLTGGTSGPGFKTWHIDSLVQGHFGVGPDPESALGPIPEYYSAGANDKAAVGLYDDRFTFHLSGFQFDMVNNGNVYVHNSLSADFPGSFQNQGDYTAPYTDQTNESWVLTEGADTTITVSGSSFIGMYSGVREYRIIQISDTSLWLQYGHHDGTLHWYLKLIPDGFVSGGGGGPNGTTTLPLDFEGTAPDMTTFGNSTVSVVANPDATGINTSANVLETVHGNEPWAGFYFDMATPFDFSTNTNITLKVWAPITGDFRLKVEESANTNNFVELDVTVNTANSWQTISFDLTGASSGVYDRLVLFPGWNVANAGTFYIDDIEQQ
jgi:PKD repeat protein